MYYVTLDQDHRNILKCYSGKRFKFHCWCEDKDDWKEMEYFNATRIARVRIDITSEPNWFSGSGRTLDTIGVHDTGTYIKLWLLNELLDITLETSAMYCVIDFIRAGLEIKKIKY